MSARRFTVILAALALSGLAAFLSAELLLRAVALTGSGVGARLAEFDPFGTQVLPFGNYGYRQRPHAVFRYTNGTRATADSLGYRGPELTLAKSSGVRRIVLLGGSTTHGWGVDDTASIDAYMRRMLAARAPNLRFEVINAALDGYDSYQLLQRTRYDVLRLRPDLLIVNSGINDVRNARFANLTDADPRTILWRETMNRVRFEEEHGPSLWSTAKHYSLLLRLPGFVLQRLDAARSRPDTLALGYPDAAVHFEKNLRQVAALAASVGAKVVFSTPPSSLRTRYAPHDRSTLSYWLRDAETTAIYRDTLAARLSHLTDDLANHGMSVVYVRPQVPPEEFLDDAHLTAQGNARVAAVFVDVSLSLMQP